MKTSLFSLLIVPLVFLLAICMAQPPIPYNFSWSFPINVSDTEIVKAGSYAVSEYDKTINTPTDHLAFIRVVNGTQVEFSQFPNSIKWILQVEAKNCSQPGNADIYETELDRDYIRCTMFNPPPNCDYYELYFLSLRKLPAV